MTEGSENVLLEQVSSQAAMPEGTPFSWTVIGWGVTLLAAILPSFINFFSTRHLRKDVDTLQNAKRQAYDKAKFGEQRTDIIGRLNTYVTASKQNVMGKTTVASLSVALATVQSYAERLGFSEADKKVISDLLLLTRAIQTGEADSSKTITPDMIQSVIEILSKGEYLI